MLHLTELEVVQMLVQNGFAKSHLLCSNGAPKIRSKQSIETQKKREFHLKRAEQSAEACVQEAGGHAARANNQSELRRHAD